MLSKTFELCSRITPLAVSSLLTFFCYLTHINTSTGQVYFENVANSQNIAHNYGLSTPSGGISFCDFDGDGWDDLTLATKDGEQIAFFRNDNGNFKSINALVPDDTQQGQILWVDYDNDGDKDLFMASINGRNRLYRNEGDLNMVDVTAQAGLTSEQFLTYGAAFGDYNRDGWLDLYLGKRTGTPAENTSLLYMNQADGTFREVALSAGAQDPAKIPFCSAFLDYNNDLWPDLYTANDRFTGNTLLRNNKNGTFTDISLPSESGINMNAMSVTVGDYNNDGLSDIYVTNTEGGNVLLRNEGNDLFSELAATAGVGFYSVGWGALFLDADNDGWQDLYVSGAKVGTDLTSSAFYYNLKDGNFSQPQAGFVGDTVRSYSNALGDYNKDGKPDIMVMNAEPYSSQLWSNKTDTEMGWISIELEGVLSNRDAIGSNILVYTADQVQRQFTQCGTGFLGQNSTRILFGLGDQTTVDSVVIQWPTGHTDRLYDIPVESELSIAEGSTTDGEINIAEDVQLVSDASSPTSNIQSFTIFPNPASQTISIELMEDLSSPVQNLRLFDARGRLRAIYRRSLSPGVQELDISHLSAGLYWLQFQDEDGQVWQGRFVKQ
ncbi:MAG: VCBS repeat-containing protein [Saprospiraceae bacterium]|nr:VCBS repeat-containing protein [Saprospiraceae bacterium]